MIWTPEKIEKFKKKYRVYCALRDDGMYEVDGNLDISCKGLKTFRVLPPIHTLFGNFKCNDNYLVNLKGAPRFIEGRFSCYNNRLVSLEGGPRRVDGSFLCFGNLLRTLEHGPRHIGGAFNCTDNEDLRFTKSDIGYLNIAENVVCDKEQLIIQDPCEFIESLPV